MRRTQHRGKMTAGMDCTRMSVNLCRWVWSPPFGCNRPVGDRLEAVKHHLWKYVHRRGHRHPGARAMGQAHHANPCVG